MTLSDTGAYRQVIGSLMQKPSLLLEYPNLQVSDFDFKSAKICFNTIKKMFEAGVIDLSPAEVDQEIEHGSATVIQIYKNEHGLDFLKEAWNEAQLNNFNYYYERLKKYSLLRRLRKAHYDISKYYIDNKDIDNPIIEAETIERFDKATLEEILNSIEQDYSEIRNDFLNGGHAQGDPAEGIDKLIDDLKKSPSIGASLEGKIFSSVCRGARKGCFFLKSASTSAGKSRTSIFDACHLAYPKRWSHKLNNFIQEVDADGVLIEPKKVLFIVTEMDKEELQTIMLAYLSGVDEYKILTGRYDDFEEEFRVKYAAKIMKEYSGYFIIEEISDPNLQNVEATIRKYVTVDNIEYCFFDYIHTTASMITQFSKSNLREDVVLMLMANQLKQLAKDYGIFIFSATQVNALAMGDDEMGFKDEKSIRGSKAVADKCDVGYVMTKVSEKGWNNLATNLRAAIRAGNMSPAILDNPPTHVLDIYKMRRGRYKMIRIWTRLHLGTGEREDLFITNSDNQPMTEPIDLFSSEIEVEINGWKEVVK